MQLARLFRVGKKFLLRGMAMYNRYIRRDDGTYTKVAEPEPPRQETADHGSQPPPPAARRSLLNPAPGPAARRRPSAARRGLAGYLRRILDQLHLDRVDAGDLLLLGLLYLSVPGKGGRGASGGPGSAADFINVKHRT